jgi:hypothetical protein
MEIKVVQVGIERNKPLYKVIGSNFGKRDFEVNVFRAVNPIQAIERATECNYASLKTGDYFRASELDNLNDYWMLKYCYKCMNGIYKYYSDAQACAAD